MKYGLTFRERADDVWERFWLCKIQRVHRVKMDSYGRCIRCGKKVSQ